MKIQITNKQNVYFCSDPHWHHRSLVKGTSNWEDKSPCRNFDSLEEHDNTLVNNINKVVRENDILFCLGDWAFGQFQDSVNQAEIFREKINSKHIHLIFGNHDTKLRKETKLLNEIFSSYGDYKELYISEATREQGIKPLKQFIVMSHYSMRSWNKMRHGSFMLYGHSHGNLPELKINGLSQKTMDVGFDTHPEFRPYSYQEIKDTLGRRVVKTEDHH